MRNLAASYLEHFDVDFGLAPSLRLAVTAPQELKELAGLIADLFGQDKLVCIYEALSAAADSDLPHCAEIDEKVCPMDVYYVVLDFLAAHAFPSNGGS